MNDNEPTHHEQNNNNDKSNALNNLNQSISLLGDASYQVCINSDEKHKEKNPSTLQAINNTSNYAPLGLEESYRQLHSILFPCLCGGDVSSSSAILMGPRGSGKSLLLERCLLDCHNYQQKQQQQQQQQDNSIKTRTSISTQFRIVRINGILARGEDVPSVVYEIIRQLSDMAMNDRVDNTTNQLHENDGNNNTATTIPSSSDKSNSNGGNKRRKIENHFLRLRKSSFTSNLSLLEACLKVAEVDEHPILLILDELDCFTDDGERQLLLYHLLDRVATPGSNLCLVGITSSFTTLSLLEKRIRSRAEGTSQVIYVHPPKSFETVIQILSDKIMDPVIRQSFIDLLIESSSSSMQNNERNQVEKGNNDNVTLFCAKLHEYLEREFRLGKDLRWFSRIVVNALALLRFDIIYNGANDEGDDQDSIVCRLRVQHFQDAIASVGGNFHQSNDDGDENNVNNITDNKVETTGSKALLDLSVPQITVLFCIRRIIMRDEHLESAIPPLTVDRILKEYEKYRGPKVRIRLALYQLLDRGLLIPSSDHSGSGVIQYRMTQQYRSMDPIPLDNLALHVPVEMEHEVDYAMKHYWKDCPTSLREWGRKIN